MPANKNKELEQTAIDAIRAYYSDKSVSIRQCKINMRDLIDEIDTLIDALPKEEAE